MKVWIQMLIIFLFCLACILLMALNVSAYDNRQNKAQNNLIEQLY